MKSRFLLPQSPAIAPFKPQLSATRRFELARVPCPRRAKRRSGQALLLAVLIMLLAALLSAGFLAVLSGNLNQTARIADKTRAIEASRAGVAFANQQLSYSTDGDLWRPIDSNPAPQPGALGYDLYYSQLDQVQGWANKLGAPTTPAELETYRNSAYAKFPDPNQPIGNAPKFLVKVEEIPTDSAAAGYDAEHAGELKITSIGLSDDDPNVFHRTVAYKTGRKQSPWARALRSISNWDFKANTVPQVKLASVTPGTTTTDVTLDTTTLQGTLPPTPFNVVLIHRDDANPTNAATFGGVVTNTTGSTYTISGVAPAAFTAGDTLQVAAAIGTASTIDLVNSGATTPPPLQDQPNGILANGSTWLQGQIELSDLNKFGTKLVSSGAIALDSTAKQVIAPTTPPAVNYGIAGSGTLVSSEANNFPGTFTTDSAQGVTPLDLVNDAWNRKTISLGLTYNTTKTRNAENFKPAQLNSKGNLNRYRDLARDSTGIYISNTEDIEKVGTTATEMVQVNLVKMWLSPQGSTEAFTRNGTPGVTGSLEERHLRGWVAPDEFLPRGALVELLPGAPNPYIRVTFDPRSDAVPNGPDPNKAARDANGNLQSGVYTKDYAWPRDGVLFAEGNIRIRGKVKLPAAPTDGTPDLYPSLTVVSMNNIYVEGSVSVDGSVVGTAPDTSPDPNRKKLMLLAKSNVVVNPTRSVLGHVDVQTLSTNTAPVAATGTAPNVEVEIPVADAKLFQVGDVIETYAPGTTILDVRGIVSARDTTAGANTLTASVITGTTVTALSEVKTLLTDKIGSVVNGTVTTKFATVDTTDAISRRVLLQNAATDYPNLRLDLDHLAKRPNTFTFKVATEGNTTKPTDLEVKLTNKRVVAGGTFDQNSPVVQSADKLIRAIFSAPTSGTEEYPVTLPADETAAQGFSLANLEAAMNASNHAGTPPVGWRYTVTRDAALAPDNTPFFYLAGLGLRSDKFTSTAATPDNGIIDIGPDGTEVDIPLATSIRLERNNTSQTLTTNYTDSASATQSFTVPYLGFNPIYGAPDPATPVSVEDALTVDQTFYQKDLDILNSTLDSRKIATPFATNDALVLRQNNDLLPTGLTPLLPEYRVRALKLGNTDLTAVTPEIKPIDLDIDAYVYAQDGSWFVIPGDYFKPDSKVRGNADGTASYIDYDGDNAAGTGEYIDGANSGNVAGTFDAGDCADLNRNGVADPGEAEAALRFLRYNYQINFYGAILENQTARVDGAVSEWMDKMANYDSTATADKWKFINYTYDPAILNNAPNAKTLRIPQTGDLLYEE